MSKIIESPIKEFPGTIALPDHLNIQQCFAWEEAFENAVFLQKEQSKSSDSEAKKLTKVAEIFLPAYEVCIESRSIQGWDTFFPMTPRWPSAALFNWINRALFNLYNGETEIPNDSAPESTATEMEPALDQQS